MKYRFSITVLVAAFTVTVLLSPLWAQGRGGDRAAPASRTGSGSRGSGFRGRTAYPYGHGGYRYGSYPYGRNYQDYYPGLGWGYGPLPFDDNYDYDEPPLEAQGPPPEAALPQVIMPRPASRPPTPVESLMLERQGDQWVRVQSYQQPSASSKSAPAGAAQAPNVPAAASGPSKATPPAHPLPPAVLVFRDGHKEELGKYSIIGGNIYTSADYWKTGSWTRKIPIADLDVAATLKENRERGGKFALPSGPNEVVIRP